MVIDESLIEIMRKFIMEENNIYNEEVKADETVVDGTIIEETTIDEKTKTEEDVKDFADDIVAKIKELVKEGNVTHIRIRKDDTVVLNIPMTVGVIGTMLGLAAAPWAVIIATITTIGLKCTVEVEKKDGTVTVIHGKEA